MKCNINPQETIVHLRLPEGGFTPIPVQESPYFQYAVTGKQIYLAEYRDLFDQPPRERAVAIMQSVILFERIRQGYNPENYQSWPTLVGKEVVDGHHRVAYCAGLGLTGMEVENQLSTKYIQWNQAFQIGKGWIEVTMPPDWGPHAQYRYTCAETWNQIHPAVSCAGKSVLDLGCAQGYYSQRAIDSGAYEVYGLDRDEHTLVNSNPNLPLQSVVRQAQETQWLAGYGQRIVFEPRDFMKPGWNEDILSHIVLALKVSYHLGERMADFLREATNCAIETLVVQTNPNHPGELGRLGSVRTHLDILNLLWQKIEVLDSSCPTLVCTQRNYA